MCMCASERMFVSIWLTVGGDVHVIFADYIKSGGIRQQLGWYTLWIILTLNTFVPLFMCVCAQILYNHGLHVSVGDYRADWEYITMYHIYPNVRGGCLFKSQDIFSTLLFAAQHCLTADSSTTSMSLSCIPLSIAAYAALVNKTQLILHQLFLFSYFLVGTK